MWIERIGRQGVVRRKQQHSEHGDGKVDFFANGRAIEAEMIGIIEL
jgi:hypothetical protein